LHLTRYGQLTIGAKTGAQALQPGAQLHLGSACKPDSFALGSQRAAAALAARALQSEFVDAHAGAVKLGAQATAAKLDAIDDRTQCQVIGVQGACQLGRGPRAADGHIRQQRAAQSPARWRQH